MNVKNKLSRKSMKTIITMMLVAVFLIGEMFSPFAIVANAEQYNLITVIVRENSYTGPVIAGATVTASATGDTKTTDSNGKCVVLDHNGNGWKSMITASKDGYEDGQKETTVNGSDNHDTTTIILKRINNNTAPTTGVTISVTDSSNQSIPQYINSGGKSSDTIFSSPIILAANATAKISYNFTNATMAKYDFVKASGLNPIPLFPNESTMTNINLPTPNSRDAYSNDIDKQGYINTKHYVYKGKAGEQLSREISFGTPISNGILVQEAKPATDIYETQGTGSNAFLLDMPNNIAYFDNNNNKNAAVKSMKLWGYFCPQRTGSYLLGAYSDDGAYGYIIVNGVKQVFVNDWRIAPPQFRATPVGISSDTQVNTGNRYTGINLQAGNYYPIYMEWYEGCPTQAAFVPQYIYNSSTLDGKLTIPNDVNDNVNKYAIPSNELYSSKTTTPGDIAGAYFGDVSGIPFPTQDGIYYMATKFVNNNNVETSGLYGPFIVDKTPPTTPTITVTPTGWTKETASFTIGGSTDSGSGVQKYQYQIDNGSWTDYTTAVTISTEGNHIINARAVDNVGNISPTATANARIDTTAPTTPTITVIPTGWTKETASFTIGGSTDSGSGVQKYQYQIDNGSWTNYTTAVTISTEGNHTINARAVDNAGNTSGISTANAKIDVTGPTLTLTQGEKDATNGTVTITAIASDSGSGVKSITKPDGTLVLVDSTTYTVSTNGTYQFTATDNAGNTTTESITINIKPATPIITGDPPNTTSTTGKVTITIEYSADSVIKQYRINGGAWTDYTGPFDVTENCTIDAIGTNEVGTKSDMASYTVSNISLPSIISAHGLYNGSNVTNDSGSGFSVTDSIPVTLAMKVKANSSNPPIKLSVDDSSKIAEGNIVFKKYEISNDGTIGNLQTLTFGKSGDIDLSGFTMAKGGEYLITYTITPVGSGNINLIPTVDGTSFGEFKVKLNISPQPDLF